MARRRKEDKKKKAIKAAWAVPRGGFVGRLPNRVIAGSAFKLAEGSIKKGLKSLAAQNGVDVDKVAGALKAFKIPTSGEVKGKIVGTVYSVTSDIISGADGKSSPFVQNESKRSMQLGNSAASTNKYQTKFSHGKPVTRGNKALGRNQGTSVVT